MNVGDESFSLFETQMVKPSHEVITISSQEDVEVLKEKPVVTKTPSSKKKPAIESDSDFEKIAVGHESTDTDDFVRPIITTRSGRLAHGKQGTILPAKKIKKAPGIDSANLLSNERAPKKAKKWSQPVEQLRPVEYSNIQNARLLKDFMLSKHAIQKYKVCVLLDLTSFANILDV